MSRYISLIGQVFGRLTVVAESKNNRFGHRMWLCECSCGSSIITSTSNLKNGKTRSCGCYKSESTSSRCRQDLTGKKFNNLKVIEFSHVNENGTYWKCQCDCGEIKIIRAYDIKSGKSKSCGCFQRKRTSEARKLNLIGKVFNRLKVVGFVSMDIKGHSLWECDCSCGTVGVVILGSSLISGNTKSCGCLNKEITKERRGPKHQNWNPDRELVFKNRAVQKTVHSLLRRVLEKTGSIKYNKSEIMSGYTNKDFMEHMESTFQPNFTWQNHGTVWHIDHIKPVVQFVKEGITDPKAISALSNLRALSAKENLSKGSKYDGGKG
jgi:hypothetical protein